MSEVYLTLEMEHLVATLAERGASQYQTLINDALRRGGVTDPLPLDREIYFRALQECLARGVIVQGADFNRPTWPWVTLTELGRTAAARL